MVMLAPSYRGVQNSDICLREKASTSKLDPESIVESLMIEFASASSDSSEDESSSSSDSEDVAEDPLLLQAQSLLV